MSSLARAVFWSAVLVVALAVLCWGAAAGADPPSAPGNPACPDGTTADAKRTQAALRRLRSLGQGHRLLGELRRPFVVCYGDVHEGILETGRDGKTGLLLLQRDRSAAANAARLGHLVHHLVHGPPLDEQTVRTSKLSCGELVRNAELAEHAAHELENDLRQAFRLPPLAFEDLSDDYRQRCEALRKSQAKRAVM
jgi:hypothetical protein